MLAIYIDGILIFGSDNKILDELRQNLHSSFECTSLVTAQFILKTQINITEYGISLSQQTYILKILEQFGMLNCRPVGKPLDPGFHL